MFSEWVTKKAKKILKRLTPYQKNIYLCNVLINK